jgi:hypothetical protein
MMASRRRRPASTARFERAQLPELGPTLLAQTSHCLRAIESAEQRGFYLMLWTNVGPNQHPHVVWRNVATTTVSLITEYAQAAPQHNAPIVIWVMIDNADLANYPPDTAPLSERTAFSFTLPVSRGYKAVNVGLGLMATVKSGRHKIDRSTGVPVPRPTQGHGFLKATKYSDRIEYTGHGRTELQAVVNLFSTPANRAALLTG